MIAQCSNCSEMTKIHFKEQQHPKGIRETYFNCHHCNKQFTCYATDSAVRDKQKEIRRIPGLHNTDKRTRLLIEVNQRMNELKKKVINYET